MDWAFECKDVEDKKESGKDFLEKFGNFNTPIIMKLCSRYNKKIQSSRMRADPAEIAKKVAQRLNEMLQAGTEEDKEKMMELKIRQQDVIKWPLIFSEVS
jgi:hypothetical protein